MSASVDDSTRDRDTIERELRLLVSVRSAYRQRGGALPPVTQMDALLDELLAFATVPRFQYRHKWEPGDLVMWDNRCVLHKANGDYDMNEVRYLYRVMLQGSVPV